MMIIDDEWCFIHIPKTSGTNLVSIFPEERSKKYRNNELWNEFWGDKLKDFTDNQYGLGEDLLRDHTVVSHAPLSFWQKVDIVRDHKVFTIVRNPYTRFVSWYNEVKREFGVTVSFEEFIFDEYLNKMLDCSPYQCFSSKKNQLDFFIEFRNIDGSIRLDKFYKMETELEDLEMDFNIKDINKHKYHSFSYNKDYKEIYTDETIKWIQKTFIRDFEYFGYDVNPFWL